jgi:undecaprenyl-diphosphatase
MVAVTMAGDSFVLTAIALVLIGWLLAFRRWHVAAAVVIAVAGATAFVPFIKTFIQRARPTALYTGAEAFSFPSSHATLSLTIFGVVAVILAHHQPIHRRIWIYTALIVMAGGIGVSRIYLGAHWPSDVGAGALFGVAVARLRVRDPQSRACDPPGQTGGDSSGRIRFCLLRASSTELCELADGVRLPTQIDRDHGG